MDIKTYSIKFNDDIEVTGYSLGKKMHNVSDIFQLWFFKLTLNMNPVTHASLAHSVTNECM